MTPTQSMIEAAARGIASVKWKGSPPDENVYLSNGTWGPLWHEFLPEAQAALSAFLAQAEVEGFEMVRKDRE